MHGAQSAFYKGAEIETFKNLFTYPFFLSKTRARL